MTTTTKWAIKHLEQQKQKGEDRKCTINRLKAFLAANISNHENESLVGSLHRSGSITDEEKEILSIL